MTKKVDNTIDFLKLVMSIMVVGIHTHIEKYIQSVQGQFYFVSAILRLAVPFFFVVSGYYLGKKFWNKDAIERKSVLRVYVKNLIVPFLFWSILHLLPSLKNLYDTCDGNKVYFVLKIIRQMLFYPLGAMWFVLACIVGAIIIFILWEYPKVMCIIIFPLYIFALLGNNYYFLLSNTRFIDICLKVIISTRNGIFVGFPFMFLGASIAKPLLLERIKLKTLLCTVIGAYILLLIEIGLVCDKAYIDDRGLFVSYLILVPCIVMLAIKKNIFISKNTMLFRKLSSCIYYTHRFYLMIIMELLKGNTVNELFFPVIICCLMTYMISNKIICLKKIL